MPPLFRLFLPLALAPLLAGASAGIEERLLARHNQERATRGLPPLAWDPALVVSARGWADHLAEQGAFYHAPERRTDPQGENLWAGTRGYYSPEAMVDAWAREKKWYKPGVFPDNSTTGRVADVGHYTQLMWRATHSVGCAVARGAREDVLVCRYSEAGNYRGEMAF